MDYLDFFAENHKLKHSTNAENLPNKYVLGDEEVMAAPRDICPKRKTEPSRVSRFQVLTREMEGPPSASREVSRLPRSQSGRTIREIEFISDFDAQLKCLSASSGTLVSNSSSVSGEGNEREQNRKQMGVNSFSSQPSTGAGKPWRPTRSHADVDSRGALRRGSPHSLPDNVGKDNFYASARGESKDNEFKEKRSSSSSNGNKEKPGWFRALH